MISLKSRISHGRALNVMANVLNLESAYAQVVERLLQTVAWNDLNGLLYCLTRMPGCVDGVGVWNGRAMTPLMVAAAYGRDEAMRHILHFSRADVNRWCNLERVTALHCAASSGLRNAGAVVRLLLNAGANPKIADSYGLLPRDAVVLSPVRPSMMHNLKRMLDPADFPLDMDAFLMQTYKVLPCTDVREMHYLEREECGKYHTGADDRRRSPWKHDYSSRSCLDYIRGTRACPRGDRCAFAHGPWETGFHPHHYKTMMCGNGVNCNWKLCHFAHSQGELRRPPPPLPLTHGQQQLQERRFMNAVRSYHGNGVDSVHQSSSAQTELSQSQWSDQTEYNVRREDQPPQQPESSVESSSGSNN